MEKISYLDQLYYQIGRQCTDFELQIQNMGGFMSKRKKYSEVGFSKDLNFLNRVNARTILVNELVVDLDPFPQETEEQFKERIKQLIQKVKSTRCDKYGIFQSNRGIHAHIFLNEMFWMDELTRRRFREYALKMVMGDLHKVSEKVTISLELANHWKSGNPKTLIEGNIFGA